MKLFSERAALREDAARLLDELGTTAGEVAYSLYLVGAATRPRNPGESPTATYLHTVVGADIRVEAITVTKRRLVMKTQRRWCSTVRVRLPRPVRELTAAVERAQSNEPTEPRLQGEQA